MGIKGIKSSKYEEDASFSRKELTFKGGSLNLKVTLMSVIALLRANSNGETAVYLPS